MKASFILEYDISVVKADKENYTYSVNKFLPDIWQIKKQENYLIIYENETRIDSINLKANKPFLVYKKLAEIKLKKIITDKIIKKLQDK